MIIIMHPLVHHKINAYNSSNKHIFSLLTKIHRETDAVNMTGPATAMLCVLSGSSGSGSGSGSSSSSGSCCCCQCKELCDDVSDSCAV